MVRMRVCCWLLLGVGLVGCGSSASNPGTGGDPGQKDYLVDLAGLLRSTAQQGQSPPARPADLAIYEGPFPVAVIGLTNKRIVYQWGQPLKTGAEAANRVLAYESEAPSRGGWVLMQDGTVKEMTADQFKAAPRAQ